MCCFAGMPGATDSSADNPSSCRPPVMAVAKTIVQVPTIPDQGRVPPREAKRDLNPFASVQGTPAKDSRERALRLHLPSAAAEFPGAVEAVQDLYSRLNSVRLDRAAEIQQVGEGEKAAHKGAGEVGLRTPCREGPAASCSRAWRRPRGPNIPSCRCRRRVSERKKQGSGFHLCSVQSPWPGCVSVGAGRACSNKEALHTGGRDLSISLIAFYAWYRPRKRLTQLSFDLLSSLFRKRGVCLTLGGGIISPVGNGCDVYLLIHSAHCMNCSACHIQPVVHRIAWALFWTLRAVPLSMPFLVVRLRIPVWLRAPSSVSG